jgi:cell wall-associated NlpC family hydrolase
MGMRLRGVSDPHRGEAREPFSCCTAGEEAPAGVCRDPQPAGGKTASFRMTRLIGEGFSPFVELLILALLVGGCGRPAVRPGPPAFSPPSQAAEKRALPRLGYTIQAGAFANAENAARLTHSLQDRGLEATYFVARRGLYKVRIGNFQTKEQARARAEELRKAGIVEEFYVVSPGEYAIAQRDVRGEAYLREELVRSARSFIGVPYLWGGASAEAGFDCSGLTMTVYQLIGLDLPRTSREQFVTGTPVDRSSLEKGDLIFFAAVREKVSHVGIYAGNGLFIHAPGRGKKIRTDLLANEYFSRAFIGARSYL